MNGLYKIDMVLALSLISAIKKDDMFNFDGDKNK